MSFLKESEKQSDDKTSDDIYQKRTHRERPVPHTRAPFAHQISTAGADKSAAACQQHRFNHNNKILVKKKFFILIFITRYRRVWFMTSKKSPDYRQATWLRRYMA